MSYRKVQLNKLLPKPKKKNVQYLVTDSSKTKEGNVGGDGKGYCDATCAADEVSVECCRYGRPGFLRAPSWLDGLKRVGLIVWISPAVRLTCTFIAALVEELLASTAVGRRPFCR